MSLLNITKAIDLNIINDLYKYHVEQNFKSKIIFYIFKIEITCYCKIIVYLLSTYSRFCNVAIQADYAAALEEPVYLLFAIWILV